jgi:hypothetical protein
MSVRCPAIPTHRAAGHADAPGTPSSSSSPGTRSRGQGIARQGDTKSTSYHAGILCWGTHVRYRFRSAHRLCVCVEENGAWGHGDVPLLPRQAAAPHPRGVGHRLLLYESEGRVWECGGWRGSGPPGRLRSRLGASAVIEVIGDYGGGGTSSECADDLNVKIGFGSYLRWRGGRTRSS